MSKKQHDTPMLDQLESGPWPSFVTGLKRLAKDSDYMTDLMGQLEHSYKTRKGYWKGGTVGVFGYGGGVIPRFSEVAEMFPASKEFHTLRIQPPAGMHYNTDVLRKMCDIWEKHGSGLIAFHGQSGDIMFQGASTANVQGAFDELNELGFNTFLDDMHRPALPYKFKFKFSGCPNDCMNSIQRADMAVIGTWRDNMRTDEALARKWFAKHGMTELVNDVVSRCPTKAIMLKDTSAVSKGAKITSVAINDTQSLEIDNGNCVRCMHCINVMTGALATGTDKGVTILMGGKRTLKIGDLMGTVIAPFMPMKTEEDYEALVELAQKAIDFFAENALEHERTGEMIERIGLINFLEGIEMEIDPNMVTTPRTNPYVRTDGWDAEVEKINARKAA